jgi:D-alanyl-D-alanine carboxypeptidase (penicillin-binding protein 5/6)
MRAVDLRRSRLFSAVLAIALAPALAITASPSYADDEPIGGPKLSQTRVVVDPLAGAPELPIVTAQGWLVADLDSGEVLAARNPHGKFLPASTIKTLTALALLPRLNPKTVVKPSAKADNMEGSAVGLVAGHPITIDLLFTGMLIQSGNDTAQALAEAAGGEELTVRLMNEAAKRIQANDTVAVNPTGLDAEGQLSSPYDLALMGRAALQNPAYRRYTATKQATIPSPKGPFQIANKNRLLYSYSGTFGGKTGGTKKALQTYIGFAKRGNRRLVVTLMKTNFWRTEAPKLLDWGFAAAGKVTPVGVLVPPLDKLPATASSSASAVLPNSSVAPSSASSLSGASPSAKENAKVAKARSGVQLPGLPRVKWWYAVAPVAILVLVVIAMTVRRRRRRRRGFYMPETKLKLPVR